MAVGVDNVRAGEGFTFNYDYSSESMPQNGGSMNGKLYYIVTSTDIYGLNLPTDIKTKKREEVFARGGPLPKVIPLCHWIISHF